MAEYQYENARNTKFWIKVVSVFLAVIIVLGALVELLCQTSMVKNRIEVSAMMSDYTKEIVDTSKAVAIDKKTMAEGDNIVAVQNRDGSNTAYIFSEPITYTDQDGLLRTKDTSIQPVKNTSLEDLGYRYENGPNDIRIAFSTDAKTGARVSSGNWSYELAPTGDVRSAAGRKVRLSDMDEQFDAFQYKDLYGTGSALNFYPELNGVKDEIILPSAPKASVFAFSLTTEGATAKQNDDGTISIIEKKSKEVVQTLSTPFAYDSEYLGDDPEDTVHFSPATFELTSPTKNDGTYVYELRVRLDKDWLYAKSTRYPITIDPSSTTITNYFDTGIYSNKASNNYGTSETACSGRSSTYGYGRVLAFFVPPDSITASSTINSAYYWCRETTGRTTSTYLTPYIVNSIWLETSVKWSNKPTYYSSEAQQTKCINGNSSDSSTSKHWYKFDVKGAVTAWKNGTYPNRGLVFISNEESNGAYNWRAFATKEHSTSSYRPYAVVTYTNDSTPPTYTSVTGNATDWTNQNVTLTVNGAADSGSGLAAEAYSFSTDENTKYWQASNSKTFSENCTVYIHIRDASGNVTSAGSQTIQYIDKKKPTLQTPFVTPTGWTKLGARIQASGIDLGGSGLAGYSFSQTNSPGEWQTSSSKMVSNNGTYYIFVKDNAGNISDAKVVTISNIDKVAPVIDSVDVSESSQAGRLHIEVSAHDDQSGIASYSFDGGETWQDSNATEIDTDTLDSLVVQVKDAVGNIGTSSVSQSVPHFYMDGQLVGLTEPANGTDDIQYKIGADGEWTDYDVPFAIPAFETTSVYARVGENGVVVHKDITSVSKYYGSYHESHTDFTLGYRNLSFDFVRNYDSADHAWFFSTDASVEAVNTIVYKAMLPDGTELAFVKKENNIFVNEMTGYKLTTNRNETLDIESYTVTADDITYHYAADGKLSGISNKYGDEITLARTDHSIDISDGTTIGKRHYVIALDNDGNITSITDPANKTISYSYDANGNLSTVVDQAGVTIGSYSYTETANGSGEYRMTRSMDKTIQYNAAGRVTKELWDSGAYTNYTYNDEALTITSTSSDTSSSSTTYNDAFLVTSSTDDHGEATEYTYNRLFQVASETVGNKTTSYTYDEEGNMTKTVDVDGQQTVYTYNGTKQLVRETSPDGTTYYVYYGENENGGTKGDLKLAATLKKSYTGAAPTAYDASLDCFETVSYTYDNGLVTRTVDTLNHETSEFQYDRYGNTVQTSIAKVETDAQGTQTSSMTVSTGTYDLFNRALTTSSATGSATPETTATIYDEAGRTLRSDVKGDVTRTLYDSMGRVIQEIGPEDYDASLDGLPNANSYADATAGSTYVYASNNTLSSETNRLGKTTNYYYNDRGSKVREEFDIYRFSYRDHGELYEVRVNGNVKVTYDYINSGTLKDLLNSVIYNNGDVINYSYDANRNPVSEKRNNNSAPYVTYAYNDDNELTEKVNYDTGLRYVYGDNDSVTVTRLSDDSVVQTYTQSSNEGAVDSEDAVVTTINESHFGTSYTSQVTKHSTAFTSGNNTVNYSFTNNDSNNTATEAVSYNNSPAFTTAYSYDSKDNITSKAITLADNTTLDIVNTYDSKNRITSTGLGTAQQTYSYDQYGQLTQTADTANGFTESYTYDSRGNILSKTKVYDDENVPAETTTFTYDNSAWQDELTSVNGTPLTYDTNGNVLTYGNMEFEWTNGRTLSQITVNPEDENGTADVYSYTYDESGIRSSKTVNGVTTYFTTKDGVILSQTDGTNTMYFQYDNSGNPTGFLYNGTQYFYLTNQMGDVIGITDNAGTLIATYTYGAWGEVLAVTPATAGNATQLSIANANPLRYRGYYLDQESGYYYNLSRYYDSNDLRFISSDVFEIVFTTKETKCGANLYTYCGNDPLDYYDEAGFSKSKIKYKRTKTLVKTWNRYLSIPIRIRMSSVHNHLVLLSKVSDAATVAAWCIPELAISKTTAQILFIVSTVANMATSMLSKSSYINKTLVLYITIRVTHRKYKTVTKKYSGQTLLSKSTQFNTTATVWISRGGYFFV